MRDASKSPSALPRPGLVGYVRGRFATLMAGLPMLGIMTQFPPQGQAHTPGSGEAYGPAVAPFGAANNYIEPVSGLLVAVGSIILPNVATIRGTTANGTGTRSLIGMDAGSIADVGDFGSGDVQFRYSSAFSSLNYVFEPPGSPLWHYYKRISGVDTEVYQLDINGHAAIYGILPTVASGLPPFRGIDDRTAVMATDGSPKNVYTMPATTAKVRITASVVGRAGTITSAVYVVKYIVNGGTVTKTLSISAVDTDADVTVLCQPDAGTAITAQLTTLSGTSPSVDVTCLVEGVGTNA